MKSDLAFWITIAAVILTGVLMLVMDC